MELIKSEGEKKQKQCKKEEVTEKQTEKEKCPKGASEKTKGMGDPGRWRGATHGAVETGHINSHEMKSFKFVLKFEKKKTT